MMSIRSFSSHPSRAMPKWFCAMNVAVVGMVLVTTGVPLTMASGIDTMFRSMLVLTSMALARRSKGAIS